MESGDEEVVALANLSDNLQQKVKALAEQPFDLVAKKRQAPVAEQTSSSQPSANGLQSTASTAPGGNEASAASASDASGMTEAPEQADGGLKGLKAMVAGNDTSGLVARTAQSLSKLDVAKGDSDRT